MSPREAIADWHAGAVNEANAIRLMRRLVSFSPWIVEITDEGVRDLLTGGPGVQRRFRPDSEGHSWAFVFSDQEAYRDYLQQTGAAASGKGAYVELDGKTAFGTALGAADRVGVNSYSPEHVHYEPAQFGGLRNLISAVEVEEALVQLQGPSSPSAPLLCVVSRYSAYRICLRRFEGEHQLVLQTDEGGRQFLTAFTFVDCVDSVREAVEEPGAEDALIQVAKTGEELFALVLQQSLDGICFNWWGPVPRVRVRTEVVRAVLDAG